MCKLASDSVSPVVGVAPVYFQVPVAAALRRKAWLQQTPHTQQRSEASDQSSVVERSCLLCRCIVCMPSYPRGLMLARVVPLLTLGLAAWRRTQADLMASTPRLSIASVHAMAPFSELVLSGVPPAGFSPLA